MELQHKNPLLTKHYIDWDPVNVKDEFITCPTCDGIGTEEEMNCDRGTASGCCGGCTIDVTCSECHGENEILNENYEPNEE